MNTPICEISIPKSKDCHLNFEDLFKDFQLHAKKTWKPPKIGLSDYFGIFGNPYMDVNNRSGDVNNRKAFGLRSNYVQITFKLRSITFELRKNYVKIT